MKLAELQESGTGNSIYVNPESVQLIVTNEDGDTSNIFLKFYIAIGRDEQGMERKQMALTVLGNAEEVKKKLGGRLTGGTGK